MNLPLTDFNSFLEGKIYSLGKTKIRDNWITDIKEAKKILIVEDSSATGNSLNEIREKIEEIGYKEKCKILTIFVTEKSKKLSDYYFDICPTPRMFEWNYIHHQGVNNACFDIDGVLCEDPKEEENDDGIKYINFIRHAKAKFIPTFKIGYIVTSRLEKYRSDTVYWLEKNNIKYNHLIMLNLSSKEERLKLGNHAKFKGEVYKNLKDTNIFIESEVGQARDIAQIAGKAVFCTSTSEFISDGIYTKIRNNSRRFVSKLMPLCIKRIHKKIHDKKNNKIQF